MNCYWKNNDFDKSGALLISNVEFESLCPNIRNTRLYFYLAFDFFKLRKNGENVFSQGPK
jgi:hypothetical protein